MSNGTPYLSPIVFVGSEKTYVDTYNKKPKSEKNGAIWDGDDAGLVKVKKVIKDHYLKIQDYTCAYCRQRIEVEHNGAWDTEHIIPKDSYPQFLFEPENLCVSCKDCNGAKTNKEVLRRKGRVRFPREAKDYLFCHPYFHVYTDHVRVVRKAALYLPKTEEGKRLIEICGLLRFVLKFADYDCVDEEVSMKLIMLATELQNTSNPMEQMAIMMLANKMLEEKMQGMTLAAMKRYAQG